MSVKPRNRYIVNSNIRIVASAKPYLVRVVEVNDVKLLLTLMVLLRRVNLERLYHYEVLMRFADLKNLVCPRSMSEVILKFALAQLAMEGFPSVSCHVRSYLLIFVTTQPLPQAL